MPSAEWWGAEVDGQRHRGLHREVRPAAGSWMAEHLDTVLIGLNWIGDFLPRHEIDPPGPPRHRLDLTVDLSNNASQVPALMKDVTRAALQARALDPENVYPVDVIAWTTRDAVKSGVLAQQDRLDLLASAQASLECQEGRSTPQPQR